MVAPKTEQWNWKKGGGGVSLRDHLLWKTRVKERERGERNREQAGVNQEKRVVKGGGGNCFHYKERNRAIRGKGNCGRARRKEGGFLGIRKKLA